MLDGRLMRKADGSLLTVYAAPDGHVVAGLGTCPVRRLSAPVCVSVGWFACRVRASYHKKF